MYVANEVYIPADGVRIQTPEVSGDEAVIDVQIKLNNRGLKKHAVKVEVTISNQNGGMEAKRVCPVTLFADGTEHIEQRLVIQNPKLWSVEEPNLYQCKIQILDGNKVWDEAGDTFGIRTLRLNPYSGLCVNGEPVKLRGACIHHDHGIIGAAELRDAETRKIKKLKEAGFNCIRMAHHPAGKTLLEVCDREGMLVMDEFSDMWTRTKNANDFANDFHENWEQIIEAMVAKDYNHPSVILYGMGNEIQEAGTAKGAQTGRKIHQKIKSLDPARYTTNAVNGIFACGDRFMEVVGQSMQQLGIPIPDMQQAARDGQQSSEQQSSAQGGSDALNSMMSVMVGPLADAIALHPIMTEMTEEFMETMDVAGYNYLTGRHAKEHELYPHRVVLGTETFPGDIANLWKTVQENTHVIGDMTWTGYDYLGEAGIGIFHYDGGVNFQAMYPERAAYIGDLDILGNRRSISYYREIIYGLRKTPYIGVERVNRYGKNIGQTPWMWKDNIASWTWNGYEGKTAVIDVLSDADEVELFLNGVSKGRKAAGKANDYMAVFQITYEPGELKAVAVRDGKACESFALNTAGKAEKLSIDTDRTTMEANGQDLAYVMIGLQDEAGNQNLWEEKEIAVQIEGAGSLAGFGSAEPSCERSYFDTVCKTYDGYVMAVIRAGLEPGTTTLTVSAEGLEPLTISIEEI